MKKQEYVIDCRGLACPAPVLRVKETIEREAVPCLVMLVDNDAARENVSRYLSRAGYTVRLEEWEGAQAVVGERPETAAAAPAPENRPKRQEGRGQRKSWCWPGPTGWGAGMIFWGAAHGEFPGDSQGNGPGLLDPGAAECRGEAGLHGFRGAAHPAGTGGGGCAGAGVRHCLNHFKLLEQKQVGETTNMLDIVTQMQLADKVVSVT